MKAISDRFGTRLTTSALAVGLSLAGCSSTPQHTNVLIFGTNTKVALDVSQDATSGLGVTLGYKRQEAVWMPLLPNQAKPGADGGLQPSTCTTREDCPMFVGDDGLKQKDTYSVLASFGGKFTGGTDAQGKDVKATGEIAQYFATGLAARLLAVNGAALVSTLPQPLSAAQTAALNQLFTKSTAEQNVIVATVQDSKDPEKVDAEKLTKLIGKATGANVLSDGGKARISSANTVKELRNWLVIYDLDATRLANAAATE